MASNVQLDHLLKHTDDVNSFTKLYDLTAPGIYAYALSILKNSHDAEDVLHDCFLRIRENADGYISQGKPMAWILTIAKNLCMRQLRQRQLSSREVMEFDGATISDPEERLLIRACLRSLTQEEQEIVIMHAVSGMKHRQIAQFMGLKLSTVLSKYHRAIHKMKLYLEKEGSQ